MMLKLGDKNYRSWVGEPDQYDAESVDQFRFLTGRGLREHHSVLDIGCGSLRLGRLLIPFLLRGGYCGLEREEWLVDEGVQANLGREIMTLKRATISIRDDFKLCSFGRHFDFLIAYSILTHATPDQVKKIFSEAAEVLAEEGVFYATHLDYGWDYAGYKWIAPASISYQLGTLRAWGQEAGLRVERAGEDAINTQHWLKIDRW